MPNFQNREQQARSEELFEAPMRGPFTGILSEVPPDDIEKFNGFLDLLNVICQDSTVNVRPGFTGLTAMPNPLETIMGVADFYDLSANRHQLIMTPTRLLLWSGAGVGSWTPITGTLTGGATNFFEWAVVNYKLLFSQGVDKVKVYDGVVGTFSDVSVNAVAALHLMELNTYLIVANTVEGGTAFPQRIRWTSPGDPTDWISLNAGVQDLINDQGPINHAIKLFQYGYLFQQFGITQMIPTGNGLNPFQFVPISSNNKGCVYPNAIAHQGGEFAVYPGPDNIYMFDGTNATPIGDHRIQGGRLGARDRILADLATVTASSVYGYITTMVGSTYYNAYWLIIPGISVWCYNFDESNWVRFTYDKTISVAGRFSKQGVPRIIDLVGAIFAQQWSPATLVGTNPLDGFLLGFNDGTPGYVDFTNFSEKSWSITSGQHTFGDLRHQHNCKKFRIVIRDNGQVQFTITITGVIYPNPQAALDSNGQPISTNSNIVSKSKTVTMGNGSGQSVARVIEFDVPGQYLTWQITGNPGAAASFVEFCPIFDVAGEQRGA